MIFVTTGTYGFSALVQLIDQMVSEGIIDEEIFAQIGMGEYEPKNFNYTRYIKDINKYIEKSNLVITHGGMTVVELIAIGKSFVAVPNRSLHGDHQFEFLQSLNSEGAVTVCMELNSAMLLQAIYNGRNDIVTQQNFFKVISKSIAEDVNLLCK